MRQGRTGAVVNGAEIVTGEFTRNRDFRIPASDLRVAIEARVGSGLALFDASALARVLMGDSIYSNMMVLGAAWQRGLVPLTRAALVKAITLNGAAVDANLRAFDLGRWAAVQPKAAAKVLAPDDSARPRTPEEQIAHRATHLEAYQSPRLARRFRKLVDGIADERLRLAVAKGYHKVLAYKDEYEVARLHLDTMAQARAAFDGEIVPRFHLAPPFLPGKGADGRPKKRAFGPWMLRVFGVLAPLKRLRGTSFDPFGYSAERRMERALIRQYEADMAELLAQPIPDGARDAAVALAELPLTIRGFGPVKEAAATTAKARRAELWAAIHAGDAPFRQAAE
jgi:indolepyruvate ferredoxin oxidoreductase